MDFIPYLWVLAGILLACLEIFTPGFVVIFFGIGALMTGILALIFPGLNQNLLWQFIIWAISSVGSLALFRRFFKKTFHGKEIIGQVAEVTETVSPSKAGWVKFQGTLWKAISYDATCHPGDVVEIMKKDNLTLIVSKRE